MRVSVIGLGKIGLPLAVQAAGRGMEVIGADISTDVVELVNSGTPPFPGEAHLDERLRAVIESGTLRATGSTPEAVAASEITIIVVPLLVDGAGSVDFGSIDAATREIASALGPGHLVSYETTLPVGTTRHRFTPILESGSGLRAGSDFHVVHSPERVFSGRVFVDLRRYPKLVGGVTDECSRVGTLFYEQILEFDDRPDLIRGNGVWNLGAVEAAEFAKLAETTYRDVNIALANEFALFAESADIDVTAVIEAANSHPFSHIHRPGIAVGGHCIPVYPHFYLTGDPDAALPAAARLVNSSMPRTAVESLETVMGDLSGQDIVVLGAAYRGGVKETAFSGVFPLTDELTKRGARALVQDPLFSHAELRDLGFEPYHLGEEVDGAIIQTDHPEYVRLTPKDLPGCRALIDGRAILDLDAWDGIPTHVLGRGAPVES